MIELGALAQDTITGFKGIVVSHSRWLNGNLTYGLQSEELKDGKPVVEQWFDSCRVVAAKPTKKSGAPRRKAA
jgi:hypothetical protein